MLEIFVCAARAARKILYLFCWCLPPQYTALRPTKATQANLGPSRGLARSSGGQASPGDTASACQAPEIDRGRFVSRDGLKVAFVLFEVCLRLLTRQRDVYLWYARHPKAAYSIALSGRVLLHNHHGDYTYAGGEYAEFCTKYND